MLEELTGCYGVPRVHQKVDRRLHIAYGLVQASPLLKLRLLLRQCLHGFGLESGLSNTFQGQKPRDSP